MSATLLFEETPVLGSVLRTSQNNYFKWSPIFAE